MDKLKIGDHVIVTNVPVWTVISNGTKGYIIAIGFGFYQIENCPFWIHESYLELYNGKLFGVYRIVRLFRKIIY